MQFHLLNLNILPLDLIQDLANNSSFNFLLGIGIPENPFLPTVSYQDFFTFQNSGAQTWNRLCLMSIEKYKN